MSWPVKPGDVIKLAEPDYCYGLGQLVLRVTKVAQVTDPQWVSIQGVQIAWNGTDMDERQVLVRIAALRRAQR